VEAEASDPDQEKCIKLHVQTAVRKLKYHLFLRATDLYIAGNATKVINQRDIKNILVNIFIKFEIIEH
jgi:hypothetical protein